MADFATEGSDLKKMLKAARKGPVAFGFSPAKADDGNYLGLHRTKAAAQIGREAKAEGDGAKFAFGTAVVEAKLVRLTCERLMPGLAKRFKKHLKSQKVMLNVEILDIGGNVIESDIEEDLPDDPELDGDPDGDGDGDAAPEDPAAEGEALRKRMAALVEEIRALPPAFGGRLAGPFRQMLDLERAGDLEGALAAANRLDSALLLIDQHMAARAEPSPQMAQMQKAAAALRVRVEALPKGEAQDRLALALDQADRKIAAQEAEAAIAALRVIDGVLKSLASQGDASAAAPGAPGGGPPPTPPDPTPPDKSDDGEAERRDLEERRRAAGMLRAAIGMIAVPGADDAERDRLRAAADKLTEGWGDPPTRDQLRAARDGLGPFQALADEIGQAVAARRLARDAAADRVRALTVEHADEEEADEIAPEQAAILKDCLPDTPSAEQLAEADRRTAALKLPSDRIREAVAARVQRAAAIALARTEAQKVPGATGEEADRLAAAGARVAGLDGFPSRGAIRAAEDALSDLDKLAAGVRAAAEARTRHAAEVDAVLKTLDWGKGTLAPHPAAPAGLTDPLRLAVAKLVQENEAYRDAGKVQHWATVDPAALAEALVALRAGAAGQVEALAAVNAAAASLAEARAKTAATIEAGAIFALSAAQKEALSNRAAAALALFATDIAEAGPAGAALAKVAAEALALQQALRGLRRRIEVVDVAPPLVSDAEKAALAALRKAAVDALAEVEA